MPLDYDRIAPTYRARYDHNAYPDVERAVSAIVDSRRDVLEVGCGTGHWLGRFAAPDRRLFGVDPSMGMLQRADRAIRGRRLVLGVAESLPFLANSFDLVFAINVLHHLDDLDAFAAGAAGVLRPGGAIATVGLDPGTGLDRWYIYDYFPGTLERDRARYPSTERVRNALTAAGFRDVKTRVAQHIPARVVARDYIEGPGFHRNCTSQLALLSDAEFEEGVGRIREAIRIGADGGTPAVLSADMRLYLTEGRMPR